MSKINNKSNFLKGIVRKIVEKEAEMASSSHSMSGGHSNSGYNQPPPPSTPPPPLSSTSRLNNGGGEYNWEGVFSEELVLDDASVDIMFCEDIELFELLLLLNKLGAKVGRENEADVDVEAGEW